MYILADTKMQMYNVYYAVSCIFLASLKPKWEALP